MTRRMGAESGQDLVEYALVLPLFLLLMFSTVEFGFIFFQYTMVVNAAREGARAGIVVDTSACGRDCLEDRIEGCRTFQDDQCRSESGGNHAAVADCQLPAHGPGDSALRNRIYHAGTDRRDGW